MEKAKQVGSSSSFTADLFGPKESSTPLFGSIFGPPTSQVSSPHLGHGTSTEYKIQKGNPMKRDEPCYYNSSIYYGGQQVYSPTTMNITPPHNDFKKDDGANESNSSSASRGNWWQGSLYY